MTRGATAYQVAAHQGQVRALPGADDVIRLSNPGAALTVRFFLQYLPAQFPPFPGVVKLVARRSLLLVVLPIALLLVLGAETLPRRYQRRAAGASAGM